MYVRTAYWLETDLLDSRRDADLLRFGSLASLASFCLWAKILANSAAASLFFSPLLLLSASLWRLRWSITGVTSLCTLGAANFCFLPSFRGRGLLITYWQTSSSLVKLNSFLILLALLGPSLLGMVLSVSPGISASPFLTMAMERTAKLPSTMHPRTDFLLRSPSRLGL